MYLCCGSELSISPTFVTPRADLCFSFKTKLEYIGECRNSVSEPGIKILECFSILL